MSKKFVQVFLERRPLPYEGTLINVGPGNPQPLRLRLRALLTESDARRLEFMRAKGAQTAKR